jgi:S1-C subfamily serine protease
LLNSLGQLIGVNTQIVSPSGASAGIGFAIPVNTVRKIIPQLVEFGREVRPIIGIETVPDDWADNQGIEGVVVLGVNRGLPADEAGIMGLRQNTRGDIFLGDIITEVNNIPVEDNDDLLNELEKYKPGDTVSITTEREQSILEFNVRLASPL